jgi:type VI secretion system FHA domain protein
MNLILKVGKGPLGGAPAGTSHAIDESGATIGRSEKNTWVLPSVEGDGVSRLHCRIVCEGGAFRVIDTKSTYGVFLNDIRVKSEGARLNDGDRLRLGEYEILVAVEAPPDPGFGEQASEPEPFEPPITPFEWEPPAPTPPRAQHIKEREGPMRQDSSPEHDIIDVVPAPKRRIIPDTWAEAESDHPPERPLPPLERSPLNRQPSSADGFTAFLTGVALPRTFQSAVDPGAALRAAGEAYRVAVEGISEILVSRYQVKDEFRIEKTRVAVAENNPLKSSQLSTDDKLSMMIAGNRSAFMPAPAAMKEALRDIKEHELALIAAIQVALKKLLEQIDPKTLEDRLEKRWLLDDLVPAARKARIWETYEIKHAEIARELEEDFQGAFGRAFAQAYEQYVRRR